MAADSTLSISGFSHVDLSVTDLDASALEPSSGVVIGLEQQDADSGAAFHERRVASTT